MVSQRKLTSEEAPWLHPASSRWRWWVRTRSHASHASAATPTCASTSPSSVAELGFVEGSEVKVISRAAGDVIVSVKGARLALNRSMASRVTVSL